MKRLAIITGTSRGLGLHLAERFLDAGFTVVGIARNNSIKNEEFHFLKMDLSKSNGVDQKLKAFLIKKNLLSKADDVVLVNNAATVLPISPVHKIKEKEILNSYNLNLHTPVILTRFLLDQFLNKAKRVTICNISSGAAKIALPDWSIYCTMKSGLKMFTDCLASDYPKSKILKAFSFYPGVMDTDMQETIRKQSVKNFKNVGKFKELKKNGDLLKPENVAAKLFELLKDPENLKKSEYDIKNLMGS